MKTQQRPQGGHKRPLPYLTEEQLNAATKALKIRVTGSYTKRAEHRKEVYEDHYEADIIVPEKWNMGHVKLATNRHIKKELKGIRARTFEVDGSVDPKPAEGKFKAKDFMSHQGILDNESAKRMYLEKRAKALAEQDAKENGSWVPPEISDTTHYGDDGLPPLVRQPAVDGGHAEDGE